MVSEHEEPTTMFDPAGREPFTAALKEAGYVEIPDYTAGPRQYCCANCPYMKPDEQSPTGYWCSEVKAPDRPEGCCDYWKPRTLPDSPPPGNEQNEADLLILP
jgi:hypothetical protein